jgi:hypothetical protein
MRSCGGLLRPRARNSVRRYIPCEGSQLLLPRLMIGEVSLLFSPGLWREARGCCKTGGIVSQVSFVNVSSLEVSSCELSHVVDTKHAGAMNRNRTFAGYARVRAATTKTAELSDVGAFMYVYDALCDDIQYVESCWTSYNSLREQSSHWFTVCTHE